jgi:NAD(P)-dependent dehydrogenase (short-subunit alcohol dehydrogenase family)
VRDEGAVNPRDVRIRHWSTLPRKMLTSIERSEVNLTGTMRVCRAALPRLRQRGGAIVNIASVAAFNSSPESVSYAASKAAVVSYTRSLAFAHGGDGIRANAVAPGWVRTPMSEYEMELSW